MKSLYLLLIPTLLFTNAALAENATPEETIYVVQQKNRRPVDDLAVDCAWASQVFVAAIQGNRSDLYSLQTKKTNGVVLKDKIKKVGELVGCFDQGSPQVERGIVPTYDAGQAWLLKLDGKQYIVTGMTRLRTDPTQEVFFGIPGTYLGVGTGTVFTPESIAMFPPVPVGSFSSNAIGNFFGVPGERNEGILTIRLYSPTPEGD